MMMYSILQGADLLQQPVIPISGLDLTLAAGLTGTSSVGLGTAPVRLVPAYSSIPEDSGDSGESWDSGDSLIDNLADWNLTI